MGPYLPLSTIIYLTEKPNSDLPTQNFYERVFLTSFGHDPGDQNTTARWLSRYGNQGEIAGAYGFCEKKMKNTFISCENRSGVKYYYIFNGYRR